MSVLDRARTVAPPGYNRWLVPPAALAVHLSIGQVYAFSVFKNPLLDSFGSSHTSIAVVFSIAIVMLGLSAAFGGRWMERHGPRKAMAVSAVFWASGFVVAALGVQLGQLWVVYLGYGVLGGIGLGLGYISPVSTLIKWFPDRPGLATGLAIMGFGGGAMLASPLTAYLLGTYADTPADAIVPTMLTLAALYAVLMAAGASVIRVPPPGWRPAGWVPPATAPKMQTTSQIPVSRAVRTPQFYLLWIVLFTNVTAGIGILEQASPMIRDFFPGVAAGAAAGFVGLLSLANMSGRFVWSSTSDHIGRQPTYVLYLGLGAVLYLVLATVGNTSIALFVAVTVVIVSFYGGGFATVPAYLKDLFGALEVGAIHGRLLTAWSAAGIAGPLIVNAIYDARSAQGAQGAALYLPSLVTMTCVLVVGLVANLLIRPVDARHAEPAPAADVQVGEAAGPSAALVSSFGPAAAGRTAGDAVVAVRAEGSDAAVPGPGLAVAEMDRAPQDGGHDGAVPGHVTVEGEPAAAAEPAAPAVTAGAPRSGSAIALGVVVAALLVYGVVQTAVKAAALFT